MPFASSGGVEGRLATSAAEVVGLAIALGGMARRGNIHRHAADRVGGFQTGGRRRIVTKNFMGGEIITIFGGFEIDLREADFQGEIVQIEIVTIFGGGEIRIPTNWSVVLETIGIFGGTTDRTRHPDESNQVTAAPGAPAPKKLIIKGVCVFGGLNVKN